MKKIKPVWINKIIRLLIKLFFKVAILFLCKKTAVHCPYFDVNFTLFSEDGARVAIRNFTQRFPGVEVTVQKRCKPWIFFQCKQTNKSLDA